MHAMHDIKRMVSAIEKEVAKPEIGEVKAINIEIGAMRHLTQEEIDTCFQHAPKHKKLMNAKINIKFIPLKVKCTDCGAETFVKGEKVKCDLCSCENVKIVAGDEFNIKSIEW